MGATATRFFMHESFQMFQLYHPPAEGDDWAWVPLNVVEWEDYATAEFPWPASGSSIPGSFVRINSSHPTSTHPEWDYSISNGSQKGGAKARAKRKNSGVKR